MQHASEARAGRNDAKLDRPAGRRQPARAHVVAEGARVHPLRDLGLGDKGPGTTAADEVAVAHEIVERGSDRQPRDSEVGAQVALGRDCLPDLERLDQVEDALTGLALFRHGTAAYAGADRLSRRAPVAGSK